jgi:hypothetical protein
MAQFLSNRIQSRTLQLALLGLVILLLTNLDYRERPQVAQSAADQWKQVTLIYHSDGKGKIEPCG